MTGEIYTLATLLTTAAVCASLKRLAVIRDSPRLWGWAEEIGATVGAALHASFLLVILPDVKIEAYQGLWIGRLAMLWWGLILACWYYSLFAECELGVSTPDSIDAPPKRFRWSGFRK